MQSLQGALGSGRGDSPHDSVAVTVQQDARARTPEGIVRQIQKKHIELAQRVYHASLIAGIALAVASTLINLLADLGGAMVALTAGFGGILLIAYLGSAVWGYFRASAITLTIVTIFVFTPALWYLNNGIDGPTEAVILMLVTNVTVVLHPFRRALTLAIGGLLAVALALVLHNYAVPSSVAAYATPQLRYFDVGATLVMCMASSYAMIDYLCTRYFSERERAERYMAQLHSLATRDQMTGALNRSQIVQEMERAISVCSATNRPLAILFVDIDYFKQINDQFGHYFGDEALIRVANVLHSSCGCGYSIGRYGGDEFLAVLPGAGEQAASELAEKLVQEIGNLQFANGCRLTVSIGVGVWDGVADAQHLLKRADQRLYGAKASGRSRYSAA